MFKLQNATPGLRIAAVASAIALFASLTSCAPPATDSQDLVLKLMQQRECSGCDLGAVNLPDTNLSGVDLTGANLAGSNLQGADLSNAKLDGADLTGADLTGANVTGVDLSTAITEGAKLP